MLNALKRLWMFWVLFVLILVMALSTSVQFHSNQIAGCERNNVLRSVVYDAVSTASDTATVGTDHYKRDIAKLRSVPYSNDKGLIDCEAATPSPWYVP